MFEYIEVQSREKHDKWFYPTIIFSIVVMAVITVFALNYSNMIFVSSAFSRGKTVSGEVSVFVENEGKVELGGVKVCILQEKKIIEWLSAKEINAEPEKEKAKLKLKYARYAVRVAEREYGAAQTAEQRANAQKEQADAATKTSRAETDYRYWFSPEYYFSGLLKDCDAQSTTDSSGNFSLLLSENKYALAMRAESGAAAKLKEDYHWLLWVTPELNGKKLVVNEENVMAANPPEKVFEVNIP